MALWAARAVKWRRNRPPAARPGRWPSLLCLLPARPRTCPLNPSLTQPLPQATFAVRSRPDGHPVLLIHAGQAEGLLACSANPALVRHAPALCPAVTASNGHSLHASQPAEHRSLGVLPQTNYNAQIKQCRGLLALYGAIRLEHAHGLATVSRIHCRCCPSSSPQLHLNCSQAHRGSLHRVQLVEGSSCKSFV